MSKKTKAAIVIGSVVIIALLIVIIVLLLRGKEEEKKESLDKRSVAVTKDNVDEVVEQMHDEKYVPPGYYNSQMTTTWHFETGDAVSEDAYVANAAENNNDVYFDVVLEEDENQVIYKSPVIPRGGELDGIKLDTKLAAGTYPCVMIYSLVDGEQNTVSTLRVGFTIIVAK
ncbi:MAG: hypothetical protein K6E98_12850 [Lachnospiraceae bacterium]|nr:hypothetical protein [Lachnospiraceae bacterium]